MNLFLFYVATVVNNCEVLPFRSHLYRTLMAPKGCLLVAFKAMHSSSVLIQSFSLSSSPPPSFLVLRR